MKDSRFPTSYAEAAHLLNTAASRAIMYKTVLVEFNDCIAVVHHSTVIVRFYRNGDMRLDTKGHQTATTKTRLNKCLPEGYSVFQENFQWYVETPEGTLDFFDGMVLWGLGRFLEAGRGNSPGSPSTPEVK